MNWFLVFTVYSVYDCINMYEYFTVVDGRALHGHTDGHE